ncbi:MAG: mechanosensitive ion channel family protein [Elusimicrobiota bacterium]
MDGFETVLRRILHDPVIGKIVLAGCGIVVIFAISGWVARRVGDRLSDNAAIYRWRKLLGIGSWVLAAAFLAFVFSDRLRSLSLAFGVAGAGIAFALQEVIASVAGWVAISMGGYYRPGDRIQLGGIVGDVIDISTFRTTIMECGGWVAGDLYSGRLVRVANSAVFKEPVFNYTADFPFLWDELKAPFRHGSDLQEVSALMLAAAADVVGEYTAGAKGVWKDALKKYRIEEEPVAPSVSMMFDENWIICTVRYVVDVKKRRSSRSAIFSSILARVAATEGKVQIACSTLEVSLHK